MKVWINSGRYGNGEQDFLTQRGQIAEECKYAGKCVIICDQYVVFACGWGKMGCNGKSKVMDGQRLTLSVPWSPYGTTLELVLKFWHRNG